jgi:FxsC-like protein
MQYLMRQAGRIDMRNATIDKFARLLVELARKNPLNASPVPVRIKQLKSPWRGPEATAQGAPRPTPVPPQAAVGPSYAQFVYVAGRADEIAGAPLTRAQEFYGAGPGDWKPYLPTLSDDVVLLTQKVALEQNLRCGDALPLDANLLQRVVAAGKQNSIVILVVDTWSLQIASYSALMDDFDRTRLRTCITLVPWNPQDPDTINRKADLEALLGKVFSLTKQQRPPYFYDAIGSLDEYRTQLSQALARLKLELVGRATVLQTAGASSTQTQPLLPIGAAQ